MKISTRKHINNECICLGITFDWNVNLAIEFDFLFWSIDFIIVENFRKFRRRTKLQTLMNRYSMKGN